MVALSILKHLYTKLVNFLLEYTHDEVNSEIFMEILIVFGVKGGHPR